MAEMFAAIDACPAPVVARVQGAALGGGMGLCAVSDVVLATADTTFGFTETKLGIIPAVISPFVLAKIGESAARALFTTGERFSAERARAIGLVHEVLADEPALDARLAQVLDELRSRRPHRGPRGEGDRPRAARPRSGGARRLTVRRHRASSGRPTRARRG